MSDFIVGDTVRCTKHPIFQDVTGVVTYRNESFAKFTYRRNGETLTATLHVSRLIKHTPQEVVSPLLQKIKELEYRFKNKNSPNPYAKPPNVPSYCEGENDEEEELYEEEREEDD